MADYLARRPQTRPDPTNQLLGNHIALKRGQPLITALGVALPTTTFPVLRGYVRLTTTEGPLQSIDLFTTAEPRMLPDGYASGWDLLDRPGVMSRLKWGSGAPLRQVIPVTLDVLHFRGLDIEQEWAALRRIARPPDGARPPALKIAGPVDHKELEWVIVGFDIVDDTKRRGHRMVRQSVLITVGEWSPLKTANTLKKGKPAKDKPRQITALAGDTLKKIAKRVLNDASRWTEIRKLNKGLHDENRPIRAGTKITVPPR